MICFRSLAAAVCLFIYLNAAGIMPVLLGFGSWVEGSHAVSFSCTTEQVSVVLHHQAAGARGAEHRHKLASRIVCLLGQSGATSPSDHVASFAAKSQCEKNDNKTTGAKWLSLPLTAAVGSPSLALLFLPDSSRALPKPAAGLCELRTTVLLI
jgi:hypothetical protein